MINLIFLSIYFFFFANPAFSETFKIVALGSKGGPLENNLSGYLIAPKSSHQFIALDAGSLLHGIHVANQQNSFQDIPHDPSSDWNFEAEILRNHITDYFISHAHLDHVAGLVINSPIDLQKNIYGIDSTIDFMRDHLFNWKIWPNFGSEGKKPLNQYQYHRLKLEKQILIRDSEISVQPFLLNHPSKYASTAFLIGFQGDYVIYFGDTSPDHLERKKRLNSIWKQVAPLIQQNKLKAIFLECSYTDATSQHQLFGHLDPKYFMEELNQLAQLVDPAQPQYALNNVKVIVTHIKEGLLKGMVSQDLIRKELEKLNTLNIPLIFPRQGQRFEI